MNFQFLVTNHDLRVLIRNYVDCSVGSLKACMERLASDVYAIANQKKDPQGRTLSITADDLPTKKSAHHLQEKLTQSGQIPKISHQAVMYTCYIHRKLKKNPSIVAYGRDFYCKTCTSHPTMCPDDCFEPYHTC